MSGPSEERILEEVGGAFDARARDTGNIKNVGKVAQAFGYTSDQLQAVPSEANMGLCCGNPTDRADIQEGEVVLDLGCGGGLDVLLAAAKVGSKGQVIGLDMSADMILLARSNALKQDLRPPQVSFVRTSLVDPLPIESGSIDCILSNCVINLLPPSGKANIFRECFRVLKPGGRLVVDDILAKTLLPKEIREDLSSYVNCISGAITRAEYEQLLADAGFSELLLSKNPGSFETYKLTTPLCCQPSDLPSQLVRDPDAWVESCRIHALKIGTRPLESPDPLLRWWDAFPIVKSRPTFLLADEVAALIRGPPGNDGDFAVIDVRRADYTGHCVKDSHQWPAQTFYNDLQLLFDEFKDTQRVIFYCGSSSGRGPRCAGWYQDYLDSRNCSTSRAFVLEGGIKGWLGKFGTDSGLVQKI